MGETCSEAQAKGAVFEFETLLEMTLKPQNDIELLKIMNDICEDFYQTSGFKSEIRLTPNDLRDYERPPKMRTSEYLDNMMELFEKGAENGGDLLSIESTGGKEVFDDAILMCDINTVFFSLIVLGVRDMKFLWKKIVDIASNLTRIKIQIICQTPDRTLQLLSGARLAHFERFLHEAPPRWRLRCEKIFFYEAFFETESQEKLNQIH